MAATRASADTGATDSTWRRNACAARCRCRCDDPSSAPLGRAYPKADWAPRFLRAKSTFQALGRDSVDAYFHGVSILRDDMRRQLFSARFRSRWAATTPSRCSGATRHCADTDDPLALVQYLDLKTYLVGDINTKVDRASMAHSLEVREPLMDHPLVDWLAHAAIVAQGTRRRRQVAAEEGDGVPAPGRMCCTGPRWVSRCRWRAGSAGRCASACAMRCWASGLRTPACSSAVTFTSWSTITSRDDATTARPLWTLLMFDAFLRNVADGPADVALRAKAA